MSPLAILAAIYAACCAVLAIAFYVAPLGYQDDLGWHAGREGLEPDDFRTIHDLGDTYVG